jgi:hypothetical protein
MVRIICLYPRRQGHLDKGPLTIGSGVALHRVEGLISIRSDVLLLFSG